MATDGESMNIPSGYDLETAKICAFLVNVVSDMSDQWKKTPDSFDWKHNDPCSITNKVFKVEDVTFDRPLIWSSFDHGLGPDRHKREPFAFIATYKGNNYLVFRGTKTQVDFDMDAKCSLVNYEIPPHCPPSTETLQVENGFYKVFNGLAKALTEQFKDLGAGSSLTIAGHSLGSTLATLAVPLAVSLGLKVQMYNQASPRVGNPAFAAYYEGLKVPTFRLVNTVDTVPTEPKDDAKNDRYYQAVGVEVDFTADYGQEKDNHNPCGSYAYALFHTASPKNPGFGSRK